MFSFSSETGGKPVPLWRISGDQQVQSLREKGWLKSSLVAAVTGVSAVACGGCSFPTTSTSPMHAHTRERERERRGKRDRVKRAKPPLHSPLSPHLLPFCREARGSVKPAVTDPLLSCSPILGFKKTLPGYGSGSGATRI
jgi:hypothetical protein